MSESIAATIDWPEELDRNRPWMIKVLRSRVGDAHTADDLMQEVAVAVLRQTSRPTDPTKVSPWLYRLVVRQAINFHRRSRAARMTRAMPVVDSPIDDLSPINWLIHDERRGQVRKALQEIPPRDRELLILKYTEDWTYEQLAKHLGVKVKTIEYRLMKARQRLRQTLVRQAAVVEV